VDWLISFKAAVSKRQMEYKLRALDWKKSLSTPRGCDTITMHYRPTPKHTELEQISSAYLISHSPWKTYTRSGSTDVSVTYRPISKRLKYR